MLFRSSLVTRERLDVNIVADRNPLFVKLSDGSIRNGYTVKILNMKQEPRSFRITMDDLPGASMEMVGEANGAANAGSIDVAVEADKLRAVKVYVASNDAGVRTQGTTKFAFKVTELVAGGEPETNISHAIFHGPGGKED